ncbi:RluA family pseudouridine synthase [Limisalsivibrio acetivorans]|uniref:RluA family pseudouridine synthase n=1 Tax=Limisalsivibrio acetivorans TaxID=1304888 RepID=UPI00058BBE7F|nr:RluA family pseudouridine synthase [Limisalsivibrio acetivorans]
MRFSDDIDETFEFTAEERGVRLDVLIASRIGRSRSLAAELINEGFVEVNGRIVSKSAKIKGGESVRVEIPHEELPHLEPQDVPFDVVHEEENLLIINKPPGITVHPAPGSPDNTLVNGILYRYSINDENEFRPGIVHRLDKDTSGLLVVAKNRDAREKLSALFLNREVEKLYTAFCFGNPGFIEKRVDAPIGRHPVDRKRMTVREDGRNALSDITVVEKYGKAFKAQVKIHTGRTHQIRVHMQHLGFPILGDSVYGPKHNTGFKMPRQALHSARLIFRNPFDKNMLDFSAPLPEDMAVLEGALKRSSSH